MYLIFFLYHPPRVINQRLVGAKLSFSVFILEMKQRVHMKILNYVLKTMTLHAGSGGNLAKT